MTDPDNGPWLDEPDWLEFVAHGFTCQIRRTPPGFLVGYIVLPLTHPLAGKPYDDVEIKVHGGWTYAEDHLPNKRAKAQWVLGFDCGHANDYAPLRPPGFNEIRELLSRRFVVPVPAPGGEYRTMNYVRSELERAAGEFALAAVPARREKGQEA